MSSIFELYTPQQIREMYSTDRLFDWPHDYERAIYEMTCAVLYTNATEEEIKAAEIEAIDAWTNGQEDDYGYLMGEFTGKDNVRYTENGPQLLLFDMNDE